MEMFYILDISNKNKNNMRRSIPPLSSAEDILTGEHFQDIAGITVCTPTSVVNNPYFQGSNYQRHAYILFANIPRNWDNPKIIFVYGHDIIYFSHHCHLLKNPFVLITHNSDVNIIPHDIFLHILSQPTCIKWYGQNVSFQHPKLVLLPIGIANRRWPHGDIDVLWDVMKHAANTTYGDTDTDAASDSDTSHHTIHFQFSVHTNRRIREPCRDIILRKQQQIPWLEEVPFRNHLQRLSTYTFCICPEGNGLDTHRLWECFYLGVIPIVKRSEHIDIISRCFLLPMMIVDSWEEVSIASTHEWWKNHIQNNNNNNNKNFVFPGENPRLTMEYWRDRILHHQS